MNQVCAGVSIMVLPRTKSMEWKGDTNDVAGALPYDYTCVAGL